MKYRSEIDGLRAVAILPVVLFHAGFAPFAGGYVGVDVFFVISGYLITGLILQDMEKGRFSLLEFYERRARRLLPALFVVLAACCVFAVAWMPPAALSEFSQYVIATSLFVSNIVLWQKTSYFSSRAEENPLLHMWSLAVEEQFYILFPLLMLLLWRNGSARVIMTVFVICFLSSLAISEYGWRNYAGANFFLLPSRAFELLTGSICALVLMRRQVAGNDLLALAGVAMIASAIFWFDHTTPFPSMLTLIPVGGTALVILFARPGTLVAHMLSMRPVVLLGLVSYSTYLWHQPLFAFARIRLPEEPGTILLLALSVLAVILGWLTWVFVERPFRKSTPHVAQRADRPRVLLPQRAHLLSASAAGLTLFILLGGAGYASGGWIQRYDPTDHYLLGIERGEQGRYVRRNFVQRQLADFSDNGQPNILLIGDSHAQDFMNVLVENGLENHANLASYYMHPRCSNLYLDFDVTNYINAEDRAMCSRQEGYASTELHQRMAQADTILVIASWRGWNVDFLEESFRNIARHTSAQLVLVGRKSFGNLSISRLLQIPQTERAGLRLSTSEGHVWINERMRELDLLFIDLHAAICGDSRECPVFTEDLRLISHDGGHLTRDGAIYVGQLLLRDSALFRSLFGLDGPLPDNP